MLIVIFNGHLQAARSFVHVAKAQETCRIRQESAGAGVLDNGRFAAGQIAESPIADPGGLQPDTGWLYAAKFAARLLNVSLIVPGSASDRPGIPHTPSALSQHLLLFGVADPQTNSQLEWLRRAPRQVQERQKAVPLFIRIGLVPILNPLVPPICYGSERRVWFGFGHGPRIQKDGRRNIMPAQTAVGKKCA